MIIGAEIFNFSFPRFLKQELELHLVDGQGCIFIFNGEKQVGTYINLLCDDPNYDAIWFEHLKVLAFLDQDYARDVIGSCKLKVRYWLNAVINNPGVIQLTKYDHFIERYYSSLVTIE